MYTSKKSLPRSRFLVGDLYYMASADRKSVVVVFRAKDFNHIEFTIPSSIRYGEREYPVIEIAYCAFAHIEMLETVFIPDSILKIGRSAFDTCNALSTVSIGKNVMEIAGSSFNNCESLTNVIISNDNPNFSFDDGVLFNKSKTKLLKCFSNKKGAYFIPISVREINDWAFYKCSSITSISIPPFITTFGQKVFYGCVSLFEINWNAKFYVNFTYDTNHQYNPFSDIAHIIKSIKFGAGVEHIPAYICFGMKNLKSINIPLNVTTIGTRAFYDCTSLESVTLGDKLKSIGDEAFYRCSSLKNIEIPSNVERFGFNAFVGSSISQLTIPSSVTNIEEGAFNCCHSLIAINVDDANEKYSSADGILFDKSRSTIIKYPQALRKNVYSIPNGVIKILDNAFGNEFLKRISIPKGVKYIGLSSEQWLYFEQITFRGTMNEFKAIKKYTIHSYERDKSVVIHCCDGDVEYIN